MTTVYRNLTTTCLAAVLAFGLAACGGGGTAMPPDTGPTVEEQLATLQDEVAALRQQLGITDAGDIGTSISALQAELKRLQDEAQARMDAEQAAKDKAMAAEARKLAVGLDGASHFNATDAGTLTVSAKYGKMATLAGADGTGFFADTATDEPNFKAADSKSLDAMNGWSGTELMSTVKNGPTDVVHVYTNVDAGKQIPFAEWAAATTGVTWANGAVTVAAGNSALIVATPFATGSGTKTHEHTIDTDTTAGADAFQTSGTFAGASGTYTCAGGTCTSAVAGSDGGVILGGTGTWTFTPNNGAMAHQADSEYQHFGWWLRKADSGYSVHTFADSTGDTAVALTAVGGTATYTGPAAGKYSIYDSGPKGGHFTAMVELKADFGNATEEGTISGMVDNFMGDAAGMDTWMVTLPELPLVSGGAGTFAAVDPAAPTAAEKTTWSIDGEDGAQGTLSQWGGSLRSADTGGTPQVAIGTFSADYGLVGNMRGAFGASHSGE